MAKKARQVREAGNMEELEWTVEQFKAWFYETFDFSTKVHQPGLASGPSWGRSILMS